MRFGLAALFCALMFPAAAQAAWHEASSEHFVVYADDSEDDIRRFSDQLERYHSTMELLTGARLERPSPSNRVTVYVVGSGRDVRELHGGDNNQVSGFYLPRAGGSLAIVPRVKARSGTADWSMVVLLHEYAHHFTLGSSAFPVPRWLGEGGAEFFAAASFDRDGSVGVGRPAAHRAYELLRGSRIDVEELLDPDAHEARRGNDGFYGMSWLLYHYLTLGEERKGQLKAYIGGLMKGKSSREAALAAFGDFDQLEDDMDDYLARRRMRYFKLAPELLKVSPMTIRRLSEGEAEMMEVRVRSKRGVTREQAAELLPQAREIAGRFPRDAAVLAALAEAEHDAGNDAEAIAAADAALALDPSQVNAYVQKGYALFRQAKASNGGVEAYKEARQPFLDLNRREPDHPLPLVYYYRYFVDQGLKPNELAMQGLERASQVAPFDLDLRMNLALQQARLGDLEAARHNLTPVAYNPHGGGMAKVARALIDKIDTDPDWDGNLGADADLKAVMETDGG